MPHILRETLQSLDWLFLPLYLPCVCFDKAVRHFKTKKRVRKWFEERQRYQQKRHHFENQRPVPNKRKRALTLPLPPVKPGDRRCQWTSEQSQSALLTLLPFDVRNLIWEMILGSEVLHIVGGQENVGYVACRDVETMSEAGYCKCHRPKDQDGFACFDKWESSEATKTFALLRTCRIIYSEAINIVYTKNIFHFKDLDTLIHFPVTVLPQRKNAIRTLRLDWVFKKPFSYPDGPDNRLYTPPADKATWERACHAIITMSGLQDLTLDLHARFWFAEEFDVPTEDRLGGVTKLLQPLRNAKIGRSFIVKVPWSAREIDEQTSSEGVPWCLVPSNKQRDSIYSRIACFGSTGRT